VCAAAFVAVAAGAGAQESGFRTGIDLVNVGVVVTNDDGDLVVDLGVDDFEIFEDGQTQRVQYFASHQSRDPGSELHLGVLLDVSQSMGEDISFVRTAVIRFLNALPEAADITVVDFDSQVRLSRYTQNDFARLIERIRGQRTGGYTALYDAVGLYLDGASGQRGRKVMLLYTDGGDTRSALRFGELLDLLKASDVTVYAIGLLQHQIDSNRRTQRSILQQLAEATGGQAFFPLSVRHLDAAYDRVLEEVHGQYVLGYVSTNDRPDGTWRQVRIRVTAGRDGDSYRVRSRKGYFAPYRLE
jgi:Ca-activated chloride channel family protein